MCSRARGERRVHPGVSREGAPGGLGCLAARTWPLSQVPAASALRDLAPREYQEGTRWSGIIWGLLAAVLPVHGLSIFWLQRRFRWAASGGRRLLDPRSEPRGPTAWFLFNFNRATPRCLYFALIIENMWSLSQDFNTLRRNQTLVGIFSFFSLCPASSLFCFSFFTGDFRVRRDESIQSRSPVNTELNVSINLTDLHVGSSRLWFKWGCFWKAGFWGFTFSVKCLQIAVALLLSDVSLQQT